MSLETFDHGAMPVFGAPAAPAAPQAAAQTPAPQPPQVETAQVVKDPDVPIEGDGGEFELAETRDIRIVDAKGLPNEAKFTEADACYDARYTLLLNRHYHGQDEPKLAKGNGGRRFTDETPISVMCVDTDYMPPPEMKVSQTWQDDLKERPKDSLVTLKWHLNSQHPAMVLRIRRDDGRPDLFVHIFTDNLVRTIQPDANWATSLSFHDKDDEQLQEALQTAGVQTKAYAKQGNVCAFSLSLWSRFVQETDPKDFGKPPKCRPLVTGIPNSELLALRGKYYADPTTCKDWERLAVQLFSANANFVFARFWPAKDLQEAHEHWQWYLQATQCVSYWGSHWGYSQQACVEEDVNIYDRHYRVKQLEIPRHLGIKWRIDGNGKVLGMAECGHFQTASVYPHSGMFPFELKVGIERDRQWVSRILRSLLSGRRSWTITAQLAQDPAYPEFWMCTLSAKVEPALLPTDKTLRPPLKARIELKVKAETWAEDGAEHKFTGQLCEDLFSRFGLSGELACYMRLDGPLSANYVPGTVLSMDCNAKFIDDPTPANRYIAGVEMLQDGLVGDRARTKGIDSPFLFLRSNPTIPSEAQGSLASELEANVPGWSAFNAVLNSRGLNNAQLDAARNSRDSRNGVTIVQGPPGTGKTHLGAAVLEAHIRAGHAMPHLSKRQCLVTGPSNNSVDVLASKFLDGLSTGNGIRKITAVRFTDGLSKPEKQRREDPQLMDTGETPSMKRQQALRDRYVGSLEEGGSVEEAEIDAAMEASFWELVASEAKPLQKEKHAALGYLVARKQWEDTIAPLTGHPLSKTITDLRAATAAQDGKRRSKADKAKIEDLENAIDKYFLTHVVDVVFCTNSTAAHHKLLDHFKPRVLMIDEAAITTIADSLTPIAAFVQSSEHVFFMGDHFQQGAKQSAKKLNEFSLAYGLSIFQTVWDNEHIENSKIVLNVQHRSHPQLVDLTSELFYPKIEGGLRSHDNVQGPNVKWDAMQTFLERMGPSYPQHKPRRLFIDASSFIQPGMTEHREIHATQCENSTSWHNELEARMLVGFIKAVCDYDPRIMPEDFLVITHYGDQCSTIRQMIASICPEYLNRIRVMTVRAVQGEEGKFVIWSMVRNTPEKPRDLGFITQKEGLNVITSRAQLAFFAFGNFACLERHRSAGAMWIDPVKTSAQAQHIGRLLAFARKKNELVGGIDLLNALFNKPPHAEPTINALLVPDAVDEAKYAAERKTAGGHGKVPPLDSFRNYQKEAKIAHRKEQREERKLHPAPKKPQPTEEEHDGVPKPEKKKKQRSKKGRDGGGPSKEGGAAEEEDAPMENAES